MRHPDKLHDAVTRFHEAEKAVNALDTIDGSPEHKVLNEIIAEIETGKLVATTAAGAFAALRLANKELKDFASGMAEQLVSGAMSFFESVEANNPGALVSAMGMLGVLPRPAGIEGAGWLAIYDGLSCCIETLCAIGCQPRGAGDAGMYLEALEDYLRSERRRLMTVAIEVEDPNRDDGNHNRLSACIHYLAEDGDFTFHNKLALLSAMRSMDKGGLR